MTELPESSALPQSGDVARCEACRGAGHVNRVVHTEGRTVVEVDRCTACQAIEEIASVVATAVSRKNTSWSAEEGQILRQLHAEGASDPEIAALVKRTSHAVSNRKLILKIAGRHPPKVWTAAELARFLEMREANYSFDAIGKEIGRSAKAVECKHAQLRAELMHTQAQALKADEALRLAERLARADSAPHHRLSLSQVLFGDPPPGRSALDQRRQGAAK